MQRLLHAEALSESIGEALEAGDRVGGRQLLMELREQCGSADASEPERLEFANSLARVHGDALLAGESGLADELLGELDTLSGREAASEEQRFVLSNALARSHWEAVRQRNREGADALLERLRTLAMRPAATEAERGVMTQVLASEVEEECSALGDRKRADTRLRELRAFAVRPGASEAQRLALARALRSAYRASCRAGDSAADRRPLLSELRELCGGADTPGPRRRVLAKALAEGHAAARNAGRDALADKVLEELRRVGNSAHVSDDERLVTVEAHVETPWSPKWRKRKKRGASLLAAIDSLRTSTAADAKRQERLVKAVVRLHAHARGGRDDEFGDELLKRVREMIGGGDRGLAGRLAFGHVLADGLWAAGQLRNRSLAEELLRELDELVGLELRSDRDRLLVTRFVLKVQHRAARVGDDQVSRTSLTHVWNLAGRPEAGDVERAVIAHGLVIAHDLALESGDLRLTAKILDALRQLATQPRATPEQWRELVNALEHSIAAEQVAGHHDVVERLEAEADQWRVRLAAAENM
jgi:hypothetical protein